jgi:hypothetical protein
MNKKRMLIVTFVIGTMLFVLTQCSLSGILDELKGLDIDITIDVTDDIPVTTSTTISSTTTSTTIASTTTTVPINTEGWTQFIPSSDSRLIYIAADGDDDMALVYSTADSEIGSDPFRPVGTIMPFETYASAATQIRVGYPDWILFKRGDSFHAQIIPQSGRDEDEYSLVSSYGTATELPLIKPVAAGTSVVDKYSRRGDNLMYAAITLLNFHATVRDHNSSEFSDISNITGINIRAAGTGSEHGIINNLIIEGCQFRSFNTNVIQAREDGILEDVTIRRCSIFDNYSDGNGHSQGLFTANLNGLLFEENILHHNGWYSQAPATPGTATIFNHNIYFNNCKNATFRGNISMQPSSIHFKFTADSAQASSTNLTLENNLYIDGEIGLSIGGNEIDPFRFQNISIRDNVFTEIGNSQPTNRVLGWALDVVDWDGGEVSGNLFIHNSNPLVTNNHVLYLEGGTRNVTFTNNRSYGIRGRQIEIDDRNSNLRTNIIFTGNILQSPNYTGVPLEINDSTLTGLSFVDNIYYSDAPPAYRIDFNPYISFEQWQSVSGDNSQFSEYTFPDSTRSIETYQDYLGETATLDAFIEGCRNQNRFNWSSQYSAETVITWLQGGYF